MNVLLKQWGIFDKWSDCYLHKNIACLSHRWIVGYMTQKLQLRNVQFIVYSSSALVFEGFFCGFFVFLRRRD
jgi:hypothetical protein